MNEEELYSNILSIEGDIAVVEAEIDSINHYADYILEDRTDIEQQLKPLEDKLAELEAELLKL